MASTKRSDYSKHRTDVNVDALYAEIKAKEIIQRFQDHVLADHEEAIQNPITQVQAQIGMKLINKVLPDAKADDEGPPPPQTNITITLD